MVTIKDFFNREFLTLGMEADPHSVGAATIRSTATNRDFMGDAGEI